MTESPRPVTSDRRTGLKDLDTNTVKQATELAAAQDSQVKQVNAVYQGLSEALRMKFSRRGFLKLAGVSAAVGVIGEGDRPIQQNPDSGPENIKEYLYYGIFPFGYGTARRLIDPITFAKNIDYARKQGEHRALEGLDLIERRKPQNRLDAWAIYLGLPPKFSNRYGTFGPSKFRPTVERESGVSYYRINDFLQNQLNFDRDFARHEGKNPENITTASVIETLWKSLQSGTVHRPLRREPSGATSVIEVDYANDVMGSFKLSLGSDERGPYISYYDLWNLEGSAEGATGLVGTPFEIYDRIYFNPDTFEPIDVQ